MTNGQALAQFRAIPGDYRDMRQPYRTESEGSEPMYIELAILLDEDLHGTDRVILRVEGPSAESVLLALVSLTGDLDETAQALSEALLRDRNLLKDEEIDASISKWINTPFHPHLVGHISVEIFTGERTDTARITVTTPSLGALIGALFVHFSGTMHRARDVVAAGLTSTNEGGVHLTTNIPAAGTTPRGITPSRLPATPPSRE